MVGQLARISLELMSRYSVISMSLNNIFIDISSMGVKKNLRAHKLAVKPKNKRKAEPTYITYTFIFM